MQKQNRTNKLEKDHLIKVHWRCLHLHENTQNCVCNEEHTPHQDRYYPCHWKNFTTRPTVISVHKIMPFVREIISKIDHYEGVLKRDILIGLGLLQFQNMPCYLGESTHLLPQFHSLLDLPLFRWFFCFVFWLVYWRVFILHFFFLPLIPLKY